MITTTLDRAVEDLFATLEKTLLARGFQISDVLARPQRVGADVLTRELNLREDERSLLFQALQLQAQAAVEAIRTATESGHELTDEEIGSVIQETPPS